MNEPAEEEDHRLVALEALCAPPILAAPGRAELRMVDAAAPDRHIGFVDAKLAQALRHRRVGREGEVAAGVEGLEPVPDRRGEEIEAVIEG